MPARLASASPARSVVEKWGGGWPFKWVTGLHSAVSGLGSRFMQMRTHLHIQCYIVVYVIMGSEAALKSLQQGV